MRRTETISATKVFGDLGYSPIEAENLRIRADLMIAIRRLIERESLTQATAAKRLGVTQPRISDLVRGKIELFSIDSLVEMLGRSGRKVRVSVGRAGSGASHAKAA